jgi:putative ABC transport system ATP-binding protein
MVVIDKLKFKYKQMIHNHDFEFTCEKASFKRGQVCAIIGSNGSGKSTALSLLAGENKPDKGTILIHRNNKKSHPTNNSIAFIGSRDKENLADELRVVDYISAVSNQKWLKSFTTYYKNSTSGSAFFQDNSISKGFLHDNLYKSVSELSSGQRQFLTLILNILTKKEVLLADEPTVFMDWEWSNRIIDLLEEISQSVDIPVVIVTHDLELVAQRVKEIFLIDNGVLSHITNLDKDCLSNEAKAVISRLEKNNV